MEYEQKGILIAIDNKMWKQLKREFTVTIELVKDLTVADVDYVYMAERGNNGTYFPGYLGQVRKITIKPASTPQNRVYSFELSKFVNPSSALEKLQFEAKGKKSGDVFDCVFEQILKNANESDGPDDMVNVNPANIDLQPLSISEAIERVADTYNVKPEKISISITG